MTEGEGDIPRVDEFREPAVERVIGRFVEGHGRPPAAVAPAIGGDVACDPEQPCPDPSARRVEPIRLAPDTDECFLHELLSFPDVTQPAQPEGVQRPGDAIGECLERGRVAGRDRHDEFRLLGAVVHQLTLRSQEGVRFTASQSSPLARE